MKPLCEKNYMPKIFEPVVTILSILPYIMFILNRESDLLWFIFITSFTLMLAYLIVDTIYWILQPNVLIYQCDEGIVIKRNIEIEYKSIEKIYCKNELSINHRRNYYRDPVIGTIFIKLKSGKIYKIRNADYPLESVNVLSKIKQQKRFR